MQAQPDPGDLEVQLAQERCQVSLSQSQDQLFYGPQVGRRDLPKLRISFFYKVVLISHYIICIVFSFFCLFFFPPQSDKRSLSNCCQGKPSDPHALLEGYWFSWDCLFPSSGISGGQHSIIIIISIFLYLSCLSTAWVITVLPLVLC